MLLSPGAWSRALSWRHQAPPHTSLILYANSLGGENLRPGHVLRVVTKPRPPPPSRHQPPRLPSRWEPIRRRVSTLAPPPRRRQPIRRPGYSPPLQRSWKSEFLAISSTKTKWQRWPAAMAVTMATRSSKDAITIYNLSFKSTSKSTGLDS